MSTAFPQVPDLVRVFGTTNATGDITVKSAEPGYRYEIHRLELSSNGTDTVTLRNGANNIGRYYLTAGQNGILDFSYSPLNTTSGNAIILNKTSAVEVSYAVTYLKVIA